MTKYLSNKKFFTEAEFEDTMTGELELQPGFIDHLDILREKYGKPMVVTHGCRSDEKLEWLLRRGYAASKDSFHLMDNKKYKTKTCALDIARPNAKDLHDLIRWAIYFGWTIGIAKTFIHLDLRSKYTKLPAIIYTYF